MSVFVSFSGSTEKLQEALRDKLEKRKTQKEGVISDFGACLGVRYIDEPMIAMKTTERCVPGDRIVIYGDAGMGKTTLLKHLTSSWLDSTSKVAQQFKFLIPVPMRLLRERSIMDIISKDTTLISPSNADSLKQSMDLHKSAALFLLDSYEELRFEEIYKLFPNSTVIATSRPGSQRTKMQQQMYTCMTTQLQLILVQEHIERHFEEHEDAVRSALQAFLTDPYQFSSL